MATKVTPTKSCIREFGDVSCSSESGRLQLKIFSKSGEKKHMAEKIFKATGLRIENNTNLPQAICRKCSEPNILTCKVIGRKRNIYYNATRSELSPRYNLYIFKTSPVLLVF